ncbi:M48 family metallopeptidase [Rhizobium leguminosarum]
MGARPSFFALFTPEPLVAAGRVIEETEAPELWRFVRSLAGRQHALLPDTIIVGLGQGFFVTESQLRLWPEDRLVTGRSLYLPAAYLDLLDQAEIAEIIGHELAHFSGEDTTYSQQFTPIYAGLWRALAALGRADGGRFVLYPAVNLGFHAMQRFDHAVAHWSRLREFDVDRSGSLLATPPRLSSARGLSLPPSPMFFSAHMPDRMIPVPMMPGLTSSRRQRNWSPPMDGAIRCPFWEIGNRIRPTAIRRRSSGYRPSVWKLAMTS